jgi:hypothetical protein
LAIFDAIHWITEAIRSIAPKFSNLSEKNSHLYERSLKVVTGMKNFFRQSSIQKGTISCGPPGPIAMAQGLSERDDWMMFASKKSCFLGSPLSDLGLMSLIVLHAATQFTPSPSLLLLRFSLRSYV